MLVWVSTLIVIIIGGEEITDRVEKRREAVQKLIYFLIRDKKR
jgi:hypothetical protein